MYIPKDYFRLPFSYDKVVADYLVIELGTSYQELRHRLKEVLDKAYRYIKENDLGELNLNGFGDMTVEDVAKETGLGLKMAALAKEREYSETLTIKGSKRAAEAVIESIKNAGMSCVFGGRFYGVTAGSDKGKAVKVLLELFKMNYGTVTSYGIGNSENDLKLLAETDFRMLVQGQDKRWSRMNISDLYKVRGIGPEGWSKAVDIIISKP
jgi:mannosyl-3-phosphoglycerate synthase